MAQPNNIETITITNFSGRLTRVINGDLNSGFAKFATSVGYDPFSKPGNLTWMEQPTSVLSSSTSLVLDAKNRAEGTSPGTTTGSPLLGYVYTVGSDGTLQRIKVANPGAPNVPNFDSPSVIGKLSANSPTFNYGASMEFFGAATSVTGGFYEQIYVGSDAQINAVNFDGSGDTKIGTTGYASNTYRPLRQFAGKLFFGNGNTVGAIDNTFTPTSSIIGTGQGNLLSELNPALGIEQRVHDLDTSIDGNYLLMTSSSIANEKIMDVSNVGDFQNSATTDGTLFLFNAVDKTTTALQSVPSYSVTALQTYLNANMFFANDAFGSSLSDGTNKLLTLPGVKSPLPNATRVNGNFITWVAPEVSGGGNLLRGSLFYFGALDQENQPGLYRLMRFSSQLVGGAIYQMPLNLLVANKHYTFNSSRTAISLSGYGKHYISLLDANSSTAQYYLYSFLVTPTGSGTAFGGIYETQTQLFSKKITVKQVRVYCEPTVANNSFLLELTGSDGNTITNGSFTYTYAAGSDPTQLQGSLDRINFNPGMNSTYALGLSIANLGSANMTIKKVEIDWAYAGK